MGSGGLIRALMAVNTGTKEGEMDRAQREATLAQYAEQRAVEEAQRAQIEKATAAAPGTVQEAKDLKTAPMTIRNEGMEAVAGDRLAGTKDTNQTKVTTTGMGDANKVTTTGMHNQSAQNVANTHANATIQAGQNRIGQMQQKGFVGQTSTLAKRAQTYNALITAIKQSGGNPAAYKPMLLNYIQYSDPNSQLRLGLAKMGMTPDESVAGKFDQFMARIAGGKPPQLLTNDIESMVEADHAKDMQTYQGMKTGFNQGGMMGAQDALITGQSGQTPPVGNLQAPRPGGNGTVQTPAVTPPITPPTHTHTAVPEFPDNPY